MNKDTTKKAKPYAYYLLAILTIVMILNFVDRNIISVLAEDIKDGLKIDDASLGFLYGTAFAVFYSIFGIPLARLADVSNRKMIIAFALFFWSLMTALSGLATSFTALALLRIGVGIGESAAIPASLSMLSDTFSKKTRATAIAVWYSGIYIGAGLGIALGGWALGLYHKWYPDYKAPLGIDDWQLAMFIVGVPGLILAIFVYFLKEPKRGHMDDTIPLEEQKKPFRFFFKELGATIPPFTFISLYNLRGDYSLFIRNILLFLILFGGAYLIDQNFGNPVQWYSLAIGFYSFFSWLQRLKVVDYTCYSMIFKTKSLIYSIYGYALFAFNSAGIGFWVTPYVIRKFDLSAQEVGGVIGLIIFSAGFLGVTMGGILSDLWKKKNPKARLLIMISATLISFPLFFLAFTTHDLSLFYIYAFIGILFSTLGNPSVFTIASELSLPNTRATTMAFLGLLVTLVGFALGPFTYGIVSTKIESMGYNNSDSLQLAIQIGLCIITPIALTLLIRASKYIVIEENTIVERSKEFERIAKSQRR